MSDEGVRVESGESYSSENLWTKIKNRIIEFLAGDRPIILNVKIEAVNTLKQHNDVYVDCTGLNMKSNTFVMTDYVQIKIKDKAVSGEKD